ncbi:YggT family protein [Neoehrlichia mikurensis]|uniref:YggT family protein n=1 Tax=Neoehrlichia mikurensis TaxID=89586 RepID=A0A9Q9BX97_9RICK|nr:YggT family protein [Neoehrlichia mikurensis]QXK92128.1 YggT family protein [Neoehrlichia mikurensis]QXK92585.1 YggT family protein [Neoehrlichia mikurensis]QXK93822.1 YggT family protein [Neoehrlichia mikurensis]UTO55183.1 YggT family protein [Neoehrlichia mikurensis]UTO56103.1 YggT family protein [Neoehrlichia mikurensis]
MHPIVYLLDILLSTYNFALIVWLLINWLITLNIINRYNEFVNNVFMALSKIFFPVLNFIKKYIPVVYGIDFSPIILLIFINFFRYTLRYYSG